MFVGEFALDFRYLAAFPNAAAQRRVVTKIEFKFRTPLKIRRTMGEIS